MKRTISLILCIIITIFTFLFFCSVTCATSSPAPRIINGETYFIKNSGQYLMVAGTGTTVNNKDNVIQTRNRSTSNIRKRQHWRVDYLGNGEYRIVSLADTSKTYVLDVFANNNSNESNIDIYSDNNSPDRRWNIILNSDNCSYRIMSKCSNYTKGLTVENASCSDNANVFQYQYNASKNDEWIFEPVYNYSKDLGINYALTNYNTYYYTYPMFNGWGSDCTNFVSQCILAGGVHF